MNNGITIGGLLLGLGACVGFAMILFGLVETYAGGMSDSPYDGDATSKQGCIVALVGLALLVGCVFGLVR